MILKDGTIKDLNTGLIWEVKCSSCGGGLYDVSNVYPWSGDVSTDTIWDWRIPNVRELPSIADYGVFNPAIDLIFGPTASNYWSSTSSAAFPSFAWVVGFGGGFVGANDKDGTLRVRAVRGGPK